MTLQTNSKREIIEQNSFDYLKLIGAFIVLLSHSFRWFEVPRFLLFFSDGATGVMIFFSISGFLAMGAYERNKAKGNGIIKFYLNRLLRIYPALIVSMLVISLLNFFMLRLNFDLMEYIKFAVKYLFLGSGAAYLGEGLSNGVLWTIPVTLTFYLITPLVSYCMEKLRKHPLTLCLYIFVFWQFNLWDHEIQKILSAVPVIGRYLDIGFPIYFMYEFMIGATLYFYIDKFIALLDKNFVIHLLVVYTVWFCILEYSALTPPFGLMHEPVSGVLVCVLCISLSYYFGRHRIKYEISYGMFLYHMVIVGALLHLGVTGITGIIIVALLTPVFAFLSCKYIEQPIFRLTHRQSRKG